MYSSTSSSSGGGDRVDAAAEAQVLTCNPRQVEPRLDQCRQQRRSAVRTETVSARLNDKVSLRPEVAHAKDPTAETLRALEHTDALGRYAHRVVAFDAVLGEPPCRVYAARARANDADLTLRDVRRGRTAAGLGRGQRVVVRGAALHAPVRSPNVVWHSRVGGGGHAAIIAARSQHDDSHETSEEQRAQSDRGVLRPDRKDAAFSDQVGERGMMREGGCACWRQSDAARHWHSHRHHDRRALERDIAIPERRFARLDRIVWHNHLGHLEAQGRGRRCEVGFWVSLGVDLMSPVGEKSKEAKLPRGPVEHLASQNLSQCRSAIQLAVRSDQGEHVHLRGTKVEG